MQYVIASDLGTGGIKSSLYDERGQSLGFQFMAYPTAYPGELLHEQRPGDWFDAFLTTVRLLIQQTGVPIGQIRALALSGHANVNVPLDAQGNLLSEWVPIWSDRRALEQAKHFFEDVDYEAWYQKTGSGDPPEIYSIMKLMWLRAHEPQLFDQIQVVLGSKDYINYRLTGVIATDPSYASGSGAFSLKDWDFDPALLRHANLPRSIFPPLYESHEPIGLLTAQAARLTGLREGTIVCAGGVDNACMALGAVGVMEGGAYLSLGSSAWIALVSEKPVLALPLRPFLFAHVQKGMFASGVSIFAAGSAHRWAKELLMPGDVKDVYEQMNQLAQSAPVGANGVLFNPTLGGGSTQNPSEHMRGGFMGLTLNTTRADMVRAVMEGVALDLSCYCLDPLQKNIQIHLPMYICGGGAKSPLWCQILSDVFGIELFKSDVDQDTATLGAAALALRGAGLKQDDSWISKAHKNTVSYVPNQANRAAYQKIKAKYKAFSSALACCED